MKPAAFRKLTATQNARLTEIASINSRIRDKRRASLNISMIRSRLNAINEILSEVRKVHLEIIAQDGAHADIYVTDGIYTQLQTKYEDT